MASRWTEDTIMALTDDQGTLNNGNKLATASRWSGTGANDIAAWGLCQGSGKKPYQTSIELLEPAYKCSCPSRKFPCKHVVGLFLLFARQPDLFTTSSPPGWVSTWLDNRQKRREKAPATGSPVDTAAHEKRSAAREAKINAGMVELRLWLRDLMRRGLADDAIKTYEFWDRIAARMVDAQAGSIARRLRDMAGLPFQGDPDWATRLLDEIGRLFLLVESYQRIDRLPEATQEDIRALIGWSYRQSELVTHAGMRDDWLVITQNYETDDRLRVRRVWLRGLHSQNMALLLDFAHRNASFEGNFTSGQVFAGELVYYPSAYPQRAIIKERPGASALQYDNLSAYDTADIPAALDAYADALALHPWLERFPVGFRAVLPFRKGSAYFIQDGRGRVLPVRFRPDVKPHAWLMKAISGDVPVPIFGEWDGYHFYPLAVRSDDIFFLF